MECDLCIHYGICKFIDTAHKYGEEYDCEKCSCREICIICRDTRKHTKEEFGLE